MLYLYAYYDSTDTAPATSPFYIGCGSGSRMFCHIREGSKHGNPYLAEVFLAHERIEVFPRIEILKTFDCSKEAKEWERDLIDYYGRRCDGSGCLCNLIRGGGGPRPEHMTVEMKRKIGEATKKMFEAGGFRESFSKAILDSWHKNGTRERHLAGLEKANASQSSGFRRNVQLKNYAENPERKLKASIAAKEVNSRPGVRESKSRKSTEANLKSWADPEIRARRIAGMKSRKCKFAQE